MGRHVNVVAVILTWSGLGKRMNLVSMSERVGGQPLLAERRGRLQMFWSFFIVCMKIHINTLRPRQNSRHFHNDNFKCIFFNENLTFSIKISLKTAPKGQFDNNPALVQIMAWRRPGDNPLSEPVY